MATIKRELSTRADNLGRCQIILRVTIGRGLQPRLKSGIYISPNRFKNGVIIKPRANQIEAAELRELEARLISIEQHLLNLCISTPREELSKEYLLTEVDRFNHPGRHKAQETNATDIWEAMTMFLERRALSNIRARQYQVLGRALKRFQLYTKLRCLPISVTLNDMTADGLSLFAEFLFNEEDISRQQPKMYAEITKGQERRSPKPRGNNYLSNLFRMLRAFYNWCLEENITTNNPFLRFKGMPTERYGTPYYITTEERDRIYNHDFSGHPELSTQRDIFIFHCLVGCRVSDLIRLTEANLINDAIEYIAQKTKAEHPDLIRVPLHPIAAELIRRYKDIPTEGKLFPFITPQRYNDAIKKIFTECGITRAVTVLNTVTGEEEQQPINEIASSHIARRTFIGNLYKKVKDPNLIGHLSGHVEGSTAFARYRDIDEDMKKEVINLL